MKNLNTINVEDIPSVVLRRIIEEVRYEQEEEHIPEMYNRTHRRHNRSGPGNYNRTSNRHNRGR